MVKAHPSVSQARKCKLSSVLLLVVANKDKDKDWLAAAAVHGGHRHTHNTQQTHSTLNTTTGADVGRTCSAITSAPE
jgi:hypothetical protein